MDSLPICTYSEVLTKASERATKVNLKEISLKHLDLNDALDSFIDAERSTVFSKLALLQLGVVQDVVD